MRSGHALVAVVAVFVLVSCGKGDTNKKTVPARVGPAPISKNAFYPYTRKDYPRYYKELGVKGIRRVEKLRRLAAKAVAKNPKCDVVSSSDYAEYESTPPNDIVLNVLCQNNEVFYVDEADLADKQLVAKSASEMSSSLTKDEMFTKCSDAISQKLPYPSSYSRDLFSISSRHSKYNGNWIMEFSFSAKNTVGIKVPMRAHCIITPKNAVEASMRPR